MKNENNDNPISKKENKKILIEQEKEKKIHRFRYSNLISEKSDKNQLFVSIEKIEMLKKYFDFKGKKKNKYQLFGKLI